MTNTFKKQFDYNLRVMEAADLAAALGYEEGYYGNLGCENVEYIERLRSKIYNLIGNKWPEVVQKAYDRNYHEGYLDS